MKRIMVFLAVMLTATLAYAFTDDADIQRATSHIESKELATKPTAPPSTYHNVYPKSDGLYIQDSGDTETKVGPPATDSIGVDELEDVDTPADEECLTYEATGATLEWETCGAGGGGDNISVDGIAVTDPNFDDGGDIDFTDTANTITATIKPGAVGQAEIAGAGVASSEIQDGSITAADLGNNSVDFAEIVNGAVRTGEILDGTIAEVDLNAVDTPADEECLTYEATVGDFEWQACGSGGGDNVSVNGGATTDPDFVSTGDITFVNIGNTITATINTDSVTNNDIAANAVRSSEIQDLAVIAGKLATNSVVLSNMQDNSVGVNELADDAVDPGAIESVDTAADEECLTYEATGDILEWQSCGSGGGDSITVETVAVVDPDFDDGGDITFVNTANTITATINADAVGAAEIDQTSTPTVAGLTIDQDQTAASGFLQGMLGDITINPSGASSAIGFGLRGEVSMVNTNDVSIALPAHQVGVIGWARNNNAATTNGTTPHMIGVEGKCENEVAKTMTTCVGVESQLSENVSGGTVGTFLAYSAQVTGSVGDLTNFSGLTMDMTSFGGNMTTANGVIINDLDEDTGDIDFLTGLNISNQTNNKSILIGYFMADQTGTHAVKDFLNNACITCRSLMGNSVLWQGTTSGTIDVVAPAVAGTNTITLPADTGTAMLTKDARVLQIVGLPDVVVDSGTTTMPLDDTIPQNTEGNEFMTQAITPNATGNKLIIKWEATVAVSNGAGDWVSCALFQDSTANALDAETKFVFAGINNHISGTHRMDAGTVSSTTFKLRCGTPNAGTTYFNQLSSGRLFGGVSGSILQITEFQP